MNEQIKRYIDPIKSFWGNLTKKRKIIIISVFAGIVLLSIIIGVLLNAQPYVVLYPGLDHDEAVEVMTELKDRDVSYKEDNGTIYVPKDQENSLRMDLSNEGHPKTAPNYDFFTSNTDMMSTDFEKKTIEKYQLNQRLEAVIKTLDGVENSNVTISLPDETGYAWDENSSAPSASVTMTLKSGKTLQAAQVNGIKQLVSKSVPNMKAEDVAVIDTATGEELSATEDSGTSQIDISQFKLAIEKSYQKDIEASVMKVLVPVFGANNVQVSAKSVMDVDKKIQEIITYNPSTSSNNRGVINEEDTQKEQETNGTSSTGGAAGTETNADTTTYPGVTVNGNTIYTKDAQSYKYLVSQVKEQIQGDAASVKDMTISVVINKAIMDDATKAQISSLVANAAAIDPSKVAVYSAAFAAPATVPTNAQAGLIPNMNQLLIYGGAALGAIILIIIIAAAIVSSRRKKKRQELLGLQTEGSEVPEDFYNLKDGEPQDGDEEVDANNPLTAQKSQAEEEKLRAKEALQELERARVAQASKEEALREEIQDFSEQNPEIAAQLIRTWLRGEDFDG